MGGQGAITSGSSWPFTEPSQEQPISLTLHLPPRRSLGWGTHTPKGTGLFLYWLLASGEGGDTLGLLRVGEGGRNSHGMLGMLML